MSKVQRGVMTLGVIFIVLGIWGFFNDPILGIFDVDGMHNMIHLGSGVLAVIFARMEESKTRQFAKVFGYVYGLIGIVGLFTAESHFLGLMEKSRSLDVVHLIFAAAFLYFGYAPAREVRPMRQATASR